MHKFFFIVIGLLVLMLSACRSHRQVVQQETHDSTTVSFRNVEKTVHLDSDTVTASFTATVLPDANQKEISFIPQTQIIETKRTSVKVELTNTGEIKATAISKELDEKVIVQEKTIRTSTNSVTVTEQKESWFKRTLNAAKTSFKTIVAIIVILAGLLAWFRFSGFIKSSISKLIKNS